MSNLNGCFSIDFSGVGAFGSMPFEFHRGNCELLIMSLYSPKDKILIVKSFAWIYSYKNILFVSKCILIVVSKIRL